MPYKDEITEVLTKPKKKSRVLIIILIVVAILALAVVSILVYYFLKQQRTEAAISTGKDYLQKGQYDEAITSFNEAIANSPKDVEAYQLKAEAAVKKNDYNTAGETYEELYNQTSNVDYLTQSDVLLSGNTSGNFSNAGKVVKSGADTFISNYVGADNMLWLFKDSLPDKANGNFDSFLKIYSVENEDNGINDLQICDGKLYFKSAGNFGYLDLTSGSFIKVPTAPENSIPVNPRFSGNKFYYLANVEGGQTGIYCENIDGSGAKRICDIAPNATTQDVATFLLYGTRAFIIYYGGRIDIVTLNDGNRSTVFDDGGSNTYGASISKGKLYFLHSTEEQGDKSIYTYDLTTGDIAELVQGEGGISTINSNEDSLFYMYNNALYRANLDGTEPQKVGEGTEYATGKESPNKPRLILLTDESVYVQYRGVNKKYVGVEGPGNPEISAATTYRASLKDLSDFHDVTRIQGFHN